MLTLTIKVVFFGVGAILSMAHARFWMQARRQSNENLEALATEFDAFDAANSAFHAHVMRCLADGVDAYTHPGTKRLYEAMRGGLDERQGGWARCGHAEKQAADKSPQENFLRAR